VCVSTGKETAGPSTPLRFAPVGMTILLQGQLFLAEALAGITELSSRPERSVVEGPAVSLPCKRLDENKKRVGKAEHLRARRQVKRNATSLEHLAVKDLVLFLTR